MHLSISQNFQQAMAPSESVFFSPLRTVLCNVQYAAYFHTVWNPPFVFQTLFTLKPAQDRLKIAFYF